MEKSQQVAPIRTSLSVQPVIPQSAEDCYRLAKAVWDSGLAPPGIKNPMQIMCIIMHGLEIGVPPMTAVQKISFISGRPVVGADLALSLALRTGELTEFKEWATGQLGTDDYTRHCRVGRRGLSEPVQSSFSVRDAKLAGLWDMRPKIQSRRQRNGVDAMVEIDNPSPWFRFPDRMLQMRARKALTDLFGDVISGVWMREEFPASGETPQAHAAPQLDEVIEPSPPAVKEAGKEDFDHPIYDGIVEEGIDYE